MKFHQIDATFGKLKHCRLAFSDGLTIIEAPNEAGKSTLITFLRAMLYGLSTRERGTLADKNRYAPWSLAPMGGTLSLSCRLGEITLQRDTARANAPMGRFSAVYTGSGERAEALTAADCGEQLIGVPGEIYERSAFIRQSSINVTQNAELERRIASLITTGEEGASYSEVSTALKKQLNARKYNKSGRIPALEAEISTLEQSQEELAALNAQKSEAEETLRTLGTKADSLRARLKLHELADTQEKQRAHISAKYTWQNAVSRAALFHRALEADCIPERSVLEQAHARLRALDALEADVAAAKELSAAAEKDLSAFDTAVQKGGRTLLYMVSAVLLAAAAVTLLIARVPSGSLRFAVPVLPLSASVLFFVKLFRAQKKNKARAQARSTLERTAQEAAATAAAQQKLYDSAARELLALLPIDDLAHADAFIRESLSRWSTYADLSDEARAAELRYESLAACEGVSSAPAEPVERPHESCEALRAALSDCESRAREAQRNIDYMAGRCRTLGSAEEISSLLAQKKAELSRSQTEYDAIALAMDALQSANTTLQNRFSPALSRRAAEIFSRLTGGKHDHVLLDRSFSALVGEAGSSTSHDAQLLSLGALDQLYLAVRLAICETVLPAEDAPPLILDDALVRFDDARCRAALDLLYEESKSRQILLFTCQHRESAYLSGRDGVTTLTL